MRISHNPLYPLRGRQSGIPTGQPNSAVRMSSPIALQSFGSRDKSHSRTGTLPFSDSKNRAGSLFFSPIRECTIKGTIYQMYFCQRSRKDTGHPSTHQMAKKWVSPIPLPHQLRWPESGCPVSYHRRAGAVGAAHARPAGSPWRAPTSDRTCYECQGWAKRYGKRYGTPINSDGQKVGVPFLTTGGLAP